VSGGGWAYTTWCHHATAPCPCARGTCMRGRTACQQAQQPKAQLFKGLPHQHKACIASKGAMHAALDSHPHSESVKVFVDSLETIGNKHAKPITSLRPRAGWPGRNTLNPISGQPRLFELGELTPAFENGWAPKLSPFPARSFLAAFRLSSGWGSGLSAGVCAGEGARGGALWSSLGACEFVWAPHAQGFRRLLNLPTDC
jgi:hypothetical protein